MQDFVYAFIFGERVSVFDESFDKAALAELPHHQRDNEVGEGHQIHTVAAAIKIILRSDRDKRIFICIK